MQPFERRALADAVEGSGEPLDPVTERQLLVGLVVLSALLVWRLNART